MQTSKKNIVLSLFLLISTVASGGLMAQPKKYVSAQKLLEDSFMLARKVYDSQFRPTFLIALWRGGTPIGIAIEEFFKCKKAPIQQHNSVRVSAYKYNQKKSEVVVYNLEYIVNTIKPTDRLLIVDDVVDSGASIKKLLEEINAKCGKNTPHDIRIATVYHKPATACFIPDYFLYQTDAWLVFPHELEGLNSEEIKKEKGDAIFEAFTTKP